MSVLQQVLYSTVTVYSTPVASDVSLAMLQQILYITGTVAGDVSLANVQFIISSTPVHPVVSDQ